MKEEYPQDKITPYGSNAAKTEQVETMFNNIATAYDKLNNWLSFGIDKRWRRKAIDNLRVFKPQRMLDIATGTGDFAILACKELQPESLVGIDISDGMMTVGREKARQENLDGIISFSHEDCSLLSFDDNSFDAITVAFGIRNFENLDKCLREMFRVLKDGGRLTILELSTPQHFPMKQLYTVYSKWVMPFVGKMVSNDSNAYSYLPTSIKACPQGTDMNYIISKAGFSETHHTPLTFGICTLYEASKRT